MHMIKTVLASLAMGGLLVGNTAVASTRSYQALPDASFDAATRASAPLIGASFLGNEGFLGGDEDDDGSGTLLLIVAAVLFGAGIYLLVDNDDDDVDSPG
ncbi:MAG TPA: hypothetical protein VHG27_03740 [Xanthobacteraceae bacterium]|nr:hypothetical protein [Xanthobacteraceae bacterium]